MLFLGLLGPLASKWERSVIKKDGDDFNGGRKVRAVSGDGKMRDRKGARVADGTERTRIFGTAVAAGCVFGFGLLTY